MDLPSGHALPEALELAPGYDLDLTSHRSRPLAGHDLSAADLVIGFEPIHVSTAVVAHTPGASTRSSSPSSSRAWRRARRSRRTASSSARAPRSARPTKRGRPHPAPPARSRDPIGGPSAGYRRTADEVYSLTSRLVELLSANPREPSGRSRSRPPGSGRARTWAPSRSPARSSRSPARGGTSPPSRRPRRPRRRARRRARSRSP